ncbi:hypothetical protein BGW80DRAFT_1454357 [Lactifluus volemus]|nr:hypothetical protein BGW80DRAFT_1454357 [Lactifluus volemus]
MSILNVRTFLPAILFTSLAYGGHHFMFGHLTKSGGFALINAQCLPNTGPYSIHYTGIEQLDSVLCIPVTFFHASFDPDTLFFFIDFVASWATPIALTFIEAARHGCSAIVGFPLILGLFYKTRGAGVAFPLFWLTLILSGHTRMDRAAARIDQARAEATLFGMLVGFALPSALLFTLQDPIVTVLWQFFPSWIWMARTAYLSFRPSPRSHTSGYGTVQATFASPSYYPQSPTLRLFGLQERYRIAKGSLRATNLPPRSCNHQSSTSYTHVFAMGCYIHLGSSLLGTLWFASNIKQVAFIVLWNVVATVIVGPGAAVSGVLLWREWRLNGPPVDASKKEL